MRLGNLKYFLLSTIKTRLHSTAILCILESPTTLHYTTLQLHYTTLHYTALHYTTLHCTTLHYTTLLSIKQFFNFLLICHFFYFSSRLNFDLEELKKEIRSRDEEIQRHLSREKELKGRIEEAMDTRKQVVLQKVAWDFNLIIYVRKNIHNHR